MDATGVGEDFFYWNQWLKVPTKTSFLGNKLKCCINVPLDKYCVPISSVLLVASEGFGSQAMLFCTLAEHQGRPGENLTQELASLEASIVPTGLFYVRAVCYTSMQCLCPLENRSSWWAGEPDDSVAQPGLWVCVCFPTEAALVRTVPWLLRGLINL